MGSLPRMKYSSIVIASEAKQSRFYFAGLLCRLRLLAMTAFFIAFCLAPAAFAGNTITPLALGQKAQGLMIVDRAQPMVSLQLSFIYAGGVSDPTDQSGRANLAAQLLMDGAGEEDGQAFRQLLESKAIKLGAAASQDNLSVSLKTLSEQLPEAIRLLTLMLTQPRFESEALARKQEEIRTDLRQAAEDPDWVAGTTWAKKAYGNHPYARNLQGTEESVSALTRADVVAWHEQALSQDRLRIAAVGDVTAEKLSQLLQPLISALPESSKLTIPTDAPAPPLGLAPIVVEKDIPQSVAVFGLPAIKRSDPDFYAAYLLNHILGGGSLVSRLSHAIREEKGLAYYAASSLSVANFSTVFMGSFATRNEQIDAAVAELESVLKRISAEGVTATELQNAKNYITGSFPLELDTQSERASYLLAIMLHQLGNDYLEKRNSYFHAVTLGQVNRLAKKLLSPLPLLVIAGKPAKPLYWNSDD